ncbi:alpha/beta fold hydrolase [Intrasporangium sp. YIM S08009]|uniref:alpha/beta fold hydrolase n=1 Tax=Intrasporangium zincisolvens TaxID=3080018 RepID=UPI002B05C8F0|nr:alpha/beta fold hydrolase [Intrasporangium sp. YIM S08009]
MTTTTRRLRLHPVDRRAFAAVVLAGGLGLAACTAGTLPVVSSRASTATTTSQEEASPAGPGAASTATTGPERDIVLAGRHFRARCDGSGPAVIVVADYGQSMDDSGTLLHDLAPNAQVCLYDRLGVGRSDSAPHLQTFASLADDLDGVISGLGLTRPVVVLALVNGAPIALTWASRHEKDARAVVLTEPTPPGFMGPRGALVRLLPPDDPGDLDLSNLWREQDHFNDPALNRESLDPGSWDAYLRLPSTSTPLYDLVGAASRPWPASVDGKKINQAWQQAQSRVLRLSSTSELVTVAKDADWPPTIKQALERALQS